MDRNTLTECAKSTLSKFYTDPLAEMVTRSKKLRRRACGVLLNLPQTKLSLPLGVHFHNRNVCVVEVLSFWACPKGMVKCMTSVIFCSSVCDQTDKTLAVP